MPITPDLSLHEVREYFLLNSCVLLSEQYIGVKQKLNYICNCGRSAIIRFSNFKEGHRCKKCANERLAAKKLHSLEYIKTYFKDRGCLLLSSSYHGNHELLEYICHCGNKSVIEFNSFMRGRRCFKCGVQCRTNKLRFPFQYVQEYFDDRDCVLLAKNYVNDRISMPYICSCGNRSRISFGKFSRGDRCKSCMPERISNTNTVKFFDRSCKTKFFGSTSIDKAIEICESVLDEKGKVK